VAIEKMTVGILIFDSVEVLDFAGPYEVFSRTRLTAGVESRRSEDSAPFRVFTVAKTGAPVVATGGLRVVPDYDFVSVPRIDLGVIPGGFGTRSLLDDEQTLDWIRQTSKQAQLITSVCTGALLLARIGLLANKRATTHWGALQLLGDLDDSISVQQDKRVVEDGIITSAGVAAGIDMSLSVVEKLFGREVADETARYIEFPRAAE
jgi:transcriptional regulator GlxA family with amidase domain